MPIPEDPAVFKCFVHQVTFSTPAKFREHLEEESHVHSTESRCKRCGLKTIKVVSKAMKIIHTKVAPDTFCSTCIEDIKNEQSEAVEVTPE